MTMLFLVSYDISDDNDRDKIANILLDYGQRVQYSVFECILDKELYDEMVKRLDSVVSKSDGDSDYDNENRRYSVRIYGLCSQCEKAIKIIGAGEVIKKQDVYII